MKFSTLNVRGVLRIENRSNYLLTLIVFVFRTTAVLRLFGKIGILNCIIS